MAFWIRELLGWVLLLMGLTLMGAAILFVTSRRVVEGATLALMGIIVFRAGIHLLKVAVAARIYWKARRSE